MTRLTRRYPFSASHRLHVDSMSDTENRELFGKCNNPFGHGHNYVLEVSLSGAPDRASGMIFSRAELDELVRRSVITDLDHRDMNADVPEFKELNPTTENLALVIGRRLCKAWRQTYPQSDVRLSRVRLEETGRNSFELQMENL